MKSIKLQQGHVLALQKKTKLTSTSVGNTSIKTSIFRVNVLEYKSKGIFFIFKQNLTNFKCVKNICNSVLHQALEEVVGNYTAIYKIKNYNE